MWIFLRNLSAREVYFIYYNTREKKFCKQMHTRVGSSIFNICSRFEEVEQDFGEDISRVEFSITPLMAIVRFFVHLLFIEVIMRCEWDSAFIRLRLRVKSITIALLCQRHNAQDVDGTMTRMAYTKFDVLVFDGGNEGGNTWFTDSLDILQVSHCVKFLLVRNSFRCEGSSLPKKEKSTNQQVVKEFRWSNRNIFAIPWNKIPSSSLLSRLWGFLGVRGGNDEMKYSSSSYLISFVYPKWNICWR